MQPHLFVYKLSMAAITLQWQSGIIVTETIGSIKPQISTVCP